MKPAKPHVLLTPSARVRARITTGGQISVPAAIRRRWQTDRVVIEDQGDAMVVKPLPADPLKAVIGSVKPPAGLTTEDIRTVTRDEDALIEERRWKNR